MLRLQGCTPPTELIKKPVKGTYQLVTNGMFGFRVILTTFLFKVYIISTLVIWQSFEMFKGFLGRKKHASKRTKTKTHFSSLFRC